MAVAKGQLEKEGLAKLKTEGFKILKSGLKKCRQGEQTFRMGGAAEIADEVDSLLVRLEALLETRIAPLANISKVASSGILKPRTHPLESLFFELWNEAFPGYVRKQQDWVEVRTMFRNLDSSNFRPNRELLRRGIDNYKNSSVSWASSKEMHIFARHFPRKFLSNPLRDMSLAIVDSTRF